MQQLTFVEAGKVELREVPAPRIESGGQAIVKPLAVSRCDLDFVFARGKAPVGGPFALGHECVGEVVEVGDGVRGVAPGDKVIVPFQISCGACAPCMRGYTGNCAAVPKMAAYGLAPLCGKEFGGAMSDAILVPYADAMLVQLPAGTDPTVAAALGDNAVDGFRTVHEPLAALRDRGEAGAKVLVVAGGAPSVGLYAVAAAKALGASEVVYLDHGEDRCAVARKLGATVIQQKIEESLRIGRFPITVDASGRPEGIRLAIASTEMEGTCTSIGIYFADVPFPLFSMYTRGIRFITGRIHTRRDLPVALDLAAKGAFDLDAVATTRLPWDRAVEAWLEPAPKLVLHR